IVGNFVRRLADGDRAAGAASGAEGGFGTSVTCGYVFGRRFPPQRRVPAELRIRICGDDGNGENEFHFSLRQIRHVRMVSGAGAAIERGQELFAWRAAHVGRLRQPSELRQFLAKAGVLSLFEGYAFDGAGFERGGVVGSGGFLRAGENLRDAGKARHRSSELSGGWAVESWRMGAQRWRKSGPDQIRKRDEQIFSRECTGDVVRALAEGQRRVAVQESADVSDGNEPMGAVRCLAADEQRDGEEALFCRGRKIVVRRTGRNGSGGFR